MSRRCPNCEFWDVRTGYRCCGCRRGLIRYRGPGGSSPWVVAIVVVCLLIVVIAGA